MVPIPLLLTQDLGHGRGRRRWDLGRGRFTSAETELVWLPVIRSMAKNGQRSKTIALPG